jgi:hypothetical protein
MIRPSPKTSHFSHSASPSPPYQAWERADTAALAGWRGLLQEIIFESDTPAGKAFDVALIAAIVLSVGAVMLESVTAVQAGTDQPGGGARAPERASEFQDAAQIRQILERWRT